MHRRTLLSAMAAFGGLFGATAAEGRCTRRRARQVEGGLSPQRTRQGELSFLATSTTITKAPAVPRRSRLCWWCTALPLKAFHAATAKPDIREKLQKFSKTLELNACGNAMKAQNVGVADLMPGFVKVDQGRCGPHRGTAGARDMFICGRSASRHCRA